jgi:hypothetical protein
MRRSTLRLSAALLAAAVSGMGEAALAQGSADISTRSQTGRGNTGQGGFGGPGAPVAHVGAGTTDASTTGYSGPSSVPARPVQTTLPPLPSAELCEPYKGGPAFGSCLSVVLRQK